MALSRMLKKTASYVLASLKGSTYGKEYASPSRSLRPCWTAFLTILRNTLALSTISWNFVNQGYLDGLSTLC